MTGRRADLLGDGLRHRQAGRLGDADAALTALVAQLGPDDARLAFGVQAALGSLRRAQGRYAEAVPLLRAALALAAHGTPYEVAATLTELGVTFKYSGNFAEAEPLYRHALELLTDVLGQQHPDLATLHHNIGGLANARGDLRAAERSPEPSCFGGFC